jgi:hypothetical protein
MRVVINTAKPAEDSPVATVELRNNSAKAITASSTILSPIAARQTITMAMPRTSYTKWPSQEAAGSKLSLIPTFPPAAW